MTAPTPRLVSVSPMQRAVIGQLATDGAEDSVIAARLGISPWTVKTHMRRALHAIGCPNRTALVCALLRGQVLLRVVDGRGRRELREDVA